MRHQSIRQYSGFQTGFFVRGTGETSEFGGVSHRNHAFRDYRVRADKFLLSKCNARIHTGYCVGGDVWEVVVEADIGGQW